MTDPQTQDDKVFVLEWHDGAESDGFSLHRTFEGAAAYARGVRKGYERSHLRWCAGERVEGEFRPAVFVFPNQGPLAGCVSAEKPTHRVHHSGVDGEYTSIRNVVWPARNSGDVETRYFDYQ